MGEWVDEIWAPMRDAIPTPDAATEAGCDGALGVVRELSENLRPAPLVELGDAADQWVRKAEALMFDCAVGDVETYPTRYEELSRLREQVEAFLVDP